MNIFLWAVAHPSEYIFFFFAFCKLTYFLPFSCKYYLIHGASLDHTGRQANTIKKKNLHSHDWVYSPGIDRDTECELTFCLSPSLAHGKGFAHQEEGHASHFSEFLPQSFHL